MRVICNDSSQFDCGSVKLVNLSQGLVSINMVPASSPEVWRGLRRVFSRQNVNPETNADNADYA
jgi:hypothetical protein